LAKSYVSTTYALLIIIAISVSVIFFISNQFINWTVILNTDPELGKELTILAYIIFGLFFMRFVLRIIGNVLLADQRPAINNLFAPLGQLIALVIIYILTKTTKGSLIYIGIALSACPVIVLLFGNIFFFKRDYKSIAPSIKFIEFRYVKDLLNLGVKFFIIRIAGVIIFQSSSIIIAQFFGPAEVTPYHIAHRYFSIIDMLFTIIIIPYWSAFTEAYVKQDIQWIKTTIKNLLTVWVILVAVGFIMLLLSKPFYLFWVGDKIEIPFLLSFCFLIYFVTYTFGGIFNMFINGTGKIVLQIIGSSVGALLFIVSAIIFIKVFELGLVSIVLASIISNFYGIFLTPIQYHKIIHNKARGIWNK